MEQDKRLYDDTGKVKSFLKPIAEGRKYGDLDIIKGIKKNTEKHHPELNIGILEKEGFYYLVLKD